MVGSLEPTGIMNNKVIVLDRDMFLINTCFAARGVGDMLNETINTWHVANK